MIIAYFLFFKLLFLIGLFFFPLNLNHNFIFNSILIQILVSFLLLFIWISKSYNHQEKPLSEFEGIENFVTISFYISASASFALLFLTNFPLLTVDSELSKLSLSDYPILARFLRIALPIYSVLLIFYTKNNFLKILSVILTISFLLLSGYKGYIFSYLISLVLFMSYTLNIRNLIKYIPLFIFSSIVFLISIPLITNQSLNNYFFFLLGRLTFGEIEGAVILFQNLDFFSQINPFSQGIYNFFSKLGLTEKYILNINEKLFELIHGSNDFYMQIALPTSFEFYILFGAGGFIIFLVIELFLIIKLNNWLSSISSKRMAGIKIYTSIFLIDVLCHGNPAFKLIDFFVTLIIFISPLIFISFLKRNLILKIL